MPVHVSIDDLYNNLIQIGEGTYKEVQNSFLDPDATLVCQFLWGVFIYELPPTDYREFLWKKLCAITAKSEDDCLRRIKKLLYNLSGEELELEFAINYRHIHWILSLNDTDNQTIIQIIQIELQKFLNTPSLVMFWKNHYHSQILPSITAYNLPVHTVVSELSPVFKEYQMIIYKICLIVYQWLYTSEGESIRLQLEKELKGFFDLEGMHHGEIASIIKYTHGKNENIS